MKTKTKPNNKYGRYCTFREVFNSKVKTYNQILWEFPINCYICLELFYATNFFYLGIVLSEITAIVENSIIVSIFMPKDSQKMYQEKTKDLRIPYFAEKNVNVTASKEAISNQVPGLPDQISRKYLLLKFGVGVSNEIPESSVHSSKHKEVILGNAAQMSRKPNLAQLMQFNVLKKFHYYRSYYFPFKTKWTTTPTFNLLLHSWKNKGKVASISIQLDFVCHTTEY